MQQRVEILKALYRGADILILDEPTAVLTPQEASELFAIVRSLQAEGKSIIFITHKLERGARDRRPDHGAAPRQDDRHGPARRGDRGRARPLMVGREVLLRVEKKPAEPGEPLLTSRTSCASDERGLEAVRGVSFEVRAGEIVGIAGVDGNGQTRADRRAHGPAPAGSRARSPSAGRGPHAARAREALEAGVGHIPEDRQLRGLVLDFTLAENIALHDFREGARTRRWGWLFPERSDRAGRSGS